MLAVVLFSFGACQRTDGVPLAILLGVGLAGSYTSVTLDSACAPSALTSLALPTTASAAIEQATHASVSHTPSLPHTATCPLPSRSTAPFRYIAALSMLHATAFRTPALFLFRFPAMPSVHSQRTPPCCYGGLRLTAHASLTQDLRAHLRPPCSIISVRRGKIDNQVRVRSFLRPPKLALP